MSGKIKRLTFVGAVFTVLVSAFTLGTATKVAAAPFNCSVGFYQQIGPQLTKLDPDSGQYNDIGDAGFFPINAIGYNTEDDYIYGFIGTDGFYGNLVRIHSNGDVDSVGVPVGLPTDSAFVAGDFDESGNLYVKNLGDLDELWRVDVSEGTATVVNQSAALGISEMVYIDGTLLTIHQGNLYRINPTSGVVSSAISVSGFPPDVGPADPFGAGWTTRDDELFFSRNSTGVIYKINNYTTNSPVATPVLTASAASSNDGASCPNATSVINELDAANDTASVDSGEELDVSAAQGVLQNDSGDTITVTDYTQPAHGAVTVSSNGSFTYTSNSSFSGTDTFTYTISDTFGLTDTATVRITVDGVLAKSGTDNMLPMLSAFLAAASGPLAFIVFSKRRNHYVAR